MTSFIVFGDLAPINSVTYKKYIITLIIQVNKCISYNIVKTTTYLDINHTSNYIYHADNYNIIYVRDLCMFIIDF